MSLSGDKEVAQFKKSVKMGHPTFHIAPDVTYSCLPPNCKRRCLARIRDGPFCQEPTNQGEPKLAGTLNRRLQRRDRPGDRLLFNLTLFPRSFSGLFVQFPADFDFNLEPFFIVSWRSFHQIPILPLVHTLTIIVL